MDRNKHSSEDQKIDEQLCSAFAGKEQIFGDRSGRMFDSLQDIVSGRISEEDRNDLSQGAKVLRQILRESIQKGKPFRTIVVPTMGGRLPAAFVRGLIEDLYPSQTPSIQFVQVIKDFRDDTRHNTLELNVQKFGDAQQHFQQRIEEITRSNQGPFLIVDDYVSHQTQTMNKIREAMKQKGIEDVAAFAFKAERLIYSYDAEDTVLTPEFYKEQGIMVGCLDRKGSAVRSFDFDRHDLIGTQKNPNSAYETRLPTTSESRQAQRTIRKNLYWFGKKMASICSRSETQTQDAA